MYTVCHSPWKAKQQIAGIVSRLFRRPFVLQKAISMDTTLQEHLHNTRLQLASHVYTAACMTVFALGLQVLPGRRSVRALWAFAVSTLYLYTQRMIYATTTQPQSIGISSVAMMVSWTILDWGLLQPSRSRPSVTQVYKSLFNHIMFGVMKVHKRRREAATRAAVPSTAATPTHVVGLGDNVKQNHSKQQQQEKPLVYIFATGSAPTRDNEPLEVAAPSTVQQHKSQADAAAELLLSSSFDDSTASLAAAMTSNLDRLVPALCVLVRLIATYDIGYAVLCCISGNMWKGLTHQQQLDQGLLSAVLGPKLAYYAFHYGVSFLLPMQMGIAYAFLKLTVILLGQTELADSLPLEAFNSPILSTSISDLWGNRWHQFLRYYFQGLGYALVDETVRPILQLILPENQHKSVLATARSLVVFAMSGIWHEYITWAAYGVITGKYMAFFMLHGLAVVAESYAVHLVPKKVQARVPYWFKRVYATTFMVLTTPLFTVSYQQHGYLEYCYHPFVVPLTATIARWAGVCAC